MRIGDLDRRITIQKKTSETKDSTGYKVIVWNRNFGTMSAGFTQMAGKERVTDENRSTEREINFVIHWRNDLDNTMRVLFENNHYKIEDIKEIGRKKGLILMTSLLAQT